MDVSTQVQQELLYVAQIAQFMSPAAMTAIDQRAKRLLQQPIPATIAASPSPVAHTRVPLVKRPGTTPQPLSDLFILH